MSYEGPLFTFATSPEKEYTSYRDKYHKTTLVFGQTSKAVDLFSRETMADVLNNPLTMSTVGRPFIVIRSGDKLLVTSQIAKYGAPAVDTASPEELIGVCYEDARKEIHSAQDLYNSCSLPQKYILRCEGCFAADGPVGCLLRELKTDNTLATAECQGLSATEAKDFLQTGRTQIGPFTYVSPSLTDESSHVPETFRAPRDHSFDGVIAGSEIRAKASAERYRHIKFKDEVCPHCFIAGECHSIAYGTSEGRIRYCTGNHPYNQAETARHILRQIKIPFTDAQLTYLLRNSGHTVKRHQRTKRTATLYLESTKGWGHSRRDHNVLRFGLVRTVYPDSRDIVKFNTFKEIRDTLPHYMQDELKPFDKSKLKLTPVERATMLELLSRRQSPRFVDNWHSTQYDTLGLLFEEHSRVFKLSFRWGNRGGDLPWNVKAKNLKEVFKNYGTFLLTPGKVRHELSRNRYNS